MTTSTLTTWRTIRCTLEWWDDEPLLEYGRVIHHARKRGEAIPEAAPSAAGDLKLTARLGVAAIREPWQLMYTNLLEGDRLTPAAATFWEGTWLARRRDGSLWRPTSEAHVLGDLGLSTFLRPAAALEALGLGTATQAPGHRFVVEGDCHDQLVCAAPVLIVLAATRYRGELDPKAGMLVLWEAEIGEAVARSIRLLDIRLDEPLDLTPARRGEL
jgi:hypothetical protein